MGTTHTICVCVCVCALSSSNHIVFFAQKNHALCHIFHTHFVNNKKRQQQQPQTTTTTTTTKETSPCARLDPIITTQVTSLTRKLFVRGPQRKLVFFFRFSLLILLFYTYVNIYVMIINYTGENESF